MAYSMQPATSNQVTMLIMLIIGDTIYFLLTYYLLTYAQTILTRRGWFSRSHVLTKTWGHWALRLDQGKNSRVWSVAI